MRCGFFRAVGIAGVLFALTFTAFAQMPPATRFDITGYAVEGSPLLRSEDFSRLVSPYIGKQKTAADVQKAQQVLQQAYLDLGHCSVQVTVPKTEPDAGLVTFRLVQTPQPLSKDCLPMVVLDEKRATPPVPVAPGEVAVQPFKDVTGVASAEPAPATETKPTIARAPLKPLQDRPLAVVPTPAETKPAIAAAPTPREELAAGVSVKPLIAAPAQPGLIVTPAGPATIEKPVAPPAPPAAVAVAPSPPQEAKPEIALAPAPKPPVGSAAKPVPETPSATVGPQPAPALKAAPVVPGAEPKPVAVEPVKPVAPKPEPALRLAEAAPAIPIEPAKPAPAVAAVPVQPAPEPAAKPQPVIEPVKEQVAAKPEPTPTPEVKPAVAEKPVESPAPVIAMPEPTPREPSKPVIVAPAAAVAERTEPVAPATKPEFKPEQPIKETTPPVAIAAEKPAEPPMPAIAVAPQPEAAPVVAAVPAPEEKKPEPSMAAAIQEPAVEDKAAVAQAVPPAVVAVAPSEPQPPKPVIALAPQAAPSPAVPEPQPVPKIVETQPEPAAALPSPAPKPEAAPAAEPKVSEPAAPKTEPAPVPRVAEVAPLAPVPTPAAAELKPAPEAAKPEPAPVPRIAEAPPAKETPPEKKPEPKPAPVVVQAPVTPAEQAAPVESPAVPAPLKFDIERYLVEGNTLLKPDAISKVLQPYTGKQKDFADVQRALEALQHAYQAVGFGAVQVTLPEQELERGEVHFEVVETRVGKIEVEGNKYYAESNIRRSIPALKEGETPNSLAIARSLKVANENPTKQTQVALKAGSRDGEVDATIKVVDDNPRKYSISVDNTGTSQTGPFRLGFGFQHSNFGNRDHQLTLQYITNPDHVNKVTIFGAGYHIPLYGRGDSVDLILGYSDVDSGTVQNLFNVSGAGLIMLGRYNQNLNRIGDYEHKLAYGIDYKAFQNRVTTTSGSPLVPDITLHPLSVAYSGVWRNPGIDVNFYTSLSYNAFPHGNDAAQSDFYASRGNTNVGGGTSAEYVIWRYGGVYTQLLPQDWTLRFAFNGQTTNNALVAGEQFGVGGANSVRGFNERTYSNDKGYQFQFEAYTPELADKIGFTGGRLKLLAFFDAAGLGRNYLQPSEQTGLSISSVGLGLRLAVREKFSVRADFAQVMHDGGQDPNMTIRDGRRNSNTLHALAVWIY
jgi:hemolysin activation/secretion protein